MINQPTVARPLPFQRHLTLLVRPETLFALSGRREPTLNAAPGASTRAGRPNPFSTPLERTSYGSILDTDTNRGIVQTHLLSAVRHGDTARFERMLHEIGDTALCAHVIDSALPADGRLARPGDCLLHVLAGSRVPSREASQMTAMLLKQGANPTLLNVACETAASRAVAHRQYRQLIALVASPLANLQLRTPRTVAPGVRRWETLHDQIERLGDAQAAQILKSSARNEVDREGPIDLPALDEWEQPALLVPVPLEHEEAVLDIASMIDFRFDRDGLPTYQQALAQARAQSREVTATASVSRPPPNYSRYPSRIA